MKLDIREWLQQVRAIEPLVTIEGADAHLEIGAVTLENVKNEHCPAILFDPVLGYEPGYGVLTGSVTTPARTATTLNLPANYSKLELLQSLRSRLTEWKNRAPGFQPEVVPGGAVTQNIQEGKQVNISLFPSPWWHEEDGGRYIGTGCAVITRDPDTGEVNLGAYRNMVQDDKTVLVQAAPGKHGRLDWENYHSKGQDCPIAVSVGHHPLVFGIAAISVPRGMEYEFMGAIAGEPARVIREEVTGLPIPADADIVLAGWCRPEKLAPEGPFGEWTGYYVSAEKPLVPVIDVERVYFRNNPILLGSPPGHPNDYGCFTDLITSAQLHNELCQIGIPDVIGVWLSDAAGAQIIIVSLKQRYAGHARQVAILANQSATGPALKRYVIVVDEDIDPTDIQDVMWAVGTRADPEKAIDIMRNCRSTQNDPLIRRPTQSYSNSRAIIDACRPFEWKDEFPHSIAVSGELREKVAKKWGHLLRL
ncbi:MAG: UbiD family decarboxylase [Chloroflexi bacterium]|nr:UbiD family decarboxylase [Chloroflexota bacterium]